MHGRQVFVAVPEVVLAELAPVVAVGLQQLCNGGIDVSHAMLGTGHADGQQSGAEGVLPQHEVRPPLGAGGLPVVVGEQGAFFGDPVDVGGPASQHTPVVGTDVVVPDVIAPDDEDVGFLFFAPSGGRDGQHCKKHSGNRAAPGDGFHC